MRATHGWSERVCECEYVLVCVSDDFGLLNANISAEEEIN